MEVAFRVKKDSDLYNRYFREKTEKERAAKLGSQFMEAHLPGVNIYAMREQLTVELNDELKARFSEQLKAKVESSQGYYFHTFKKNSPMNKLWVEEVYNKLDKAAMSGMFFWFRDFFLDAPYKCSTSIWDGKDGEVYGLVESKNPNTCIQVPTYVERIKMSEYYAHLEKAYPEKS